MSHTSEKRWKDVNRTVGTASADLINVLSTAEELYLQLLELWSFAGGTDQAVADLLFQNENGYDSAGDPIPASAEQVTMAIDAKAAITSGHELYQAANNIAVAQEDRASKLRRMT